ncbi:hypothetical protein IAQ61_004390 [Plenodomus lingam]|uniref:uncharacterized protein n=1 Tax=Leptosphaeria maculans TaxID=5022 RepID=UPI00331EA3FD|nr:hypothetical protein IAQ61_004390 [Plenodomus lingam]
MPAMLSTTLITSLYPVKVHVTTVHVLRSRQTRLGGGKSRTWAAYAQLGTTFGYSHTPFSVRRGKDERENGQIEV